MKFSYLSIAKKTTKCRARTLYEPHSWSLISLLFHLDVPIHLLFNLRQLSWQLIWVLIPKYSSIILEWRETKVDYHFATDVSDREARNDLDPLYLSPLVLQPISYIMLRPACLYYTAGFLCLPAILWTPSLPSLKEQLCSKDTWWNEVCFLLASSPS